MNPEDILRYATIFGMAFVGTLAFTKAIVLIMWAIIHAPQFP